MNPQHATNWTPGLVVLALGFVIALFYVFGSRRLRNDAPKPETLDDLEARYRALLAELRQHIANQHLLPAPAFQVEKQRLEQAAADLLRARDGKRAETVRQQARAEKRAATPGTNNQLVGGIILVASVVFFVVLGQRLSASATERADGMQATGAVPPGGGGGPMQAPRQDPKLEGYAARVQQNPSDVDAVADLAIYLVRRQAFDEARPLIDRAMALDSFHPKARVGQAVMRALEGNAPKALLELETLAARYAEAYDARMFAGMLAMDENDPQRALKNLEAYITLAPPDEQPPMMRMAVMQLKQQVAGAPPGP